MTQIPTLIIGICSGIFITRMLGPLNRGYYSLFLANLEFFSLFFGLSINSAIVYFISSDKITIAKILSSTIFFLVSGTLLVSLFVISTFYFSNGLFVFPTELKKIFFVAFLIISFFLGFIYSILSSIFIGKSNFRIINQVALFNSSANLIFYGSLYLMHLKGASISLEQVLSFSMVTALLNVLVLTYFYQKLINIKPEFSNFSFKYSIAPILNYIGINHINQVVNFFNYRVDVWLVEHYKGAKELGYYSLSVNIAQMLWLVSTPIATALAPYLSNQNNKEGMKNFALLSKTNIFIIATGGLAAFFLASFLIPLLYGNEFVNSVLPFQILLIGIFASCITKISAMYVYSTGEIKYNFIATLIGLFINVLLNLYFIPKYGIIGASITTVITYWAILGFVIFFSYTRLNLPRINYYIITINDIRHITNELKLKFANK